MKNNIGQYTSVLFTTTLQGADDKYELLQTSKEGQDYFSLLQQDSLKICTHRILKQAFAVPTNFSCIDYVFFALKDKADHNELLAVSLKIGGFYLVNFKNTEEHFIGRLSDETYAEVTFGQSYVQAEQVCYGYLHNEYCLPMLTMSEETSMAFDFWYIIA